jgi:hypothetical protein
MMAAYITPRHLLSSTNRRCYYREEEQKRVDILLTSRDSMQLLGGLPASPASNLLLASHHVLTSNTACMRD